MHDYTSRRRINWNFDYEWVLYWHLAYALEHSRWRIITGIWPVDGCTSRWIIIPAFRRRDVKNPYVENLLACGLWMSKPLGGELNGHLAYERVNPHYMIIHPCVSFFSCNYYHIAPTWTSQSLHGGLKLLSCTIRNPRRRRTTFQLDLSLKNIQSLHDPLTQGR